MMRRPRLIPDARRAWRMLSVHVATGATLFGLLPADQQASLLDMIGLPASRVPAALGVAFLLARLVNQTDDTPKPPDVYHQNWAGPPKE
jgi:hypothetical protein